MFYTHDLRICAEMLPAELDLTVGVYSSEATNTCLLPAFQKELPSLYYNCGHISYGLHMGVAILLYYSYTSTSESASQARIRAALGRHFCRANAEVQRVRAAVAK